MKVLLCSDPWINRDSPGFRVIRLLERRNTALDSAFRIEKNPGGCAVVFPCSLLSGFAAIFFTLASLVSVEFIARPKSATRFENKGALRKSLRLNRDPPVAMDAGEYLMALRRKINEIDLDGLEK